MIAPLIKHVPSGVAAARPCTSGSHSCRASAYDESSRPSDRAIRMVLTADHNLTIANTGRSLGRGVADDGIAFPVQRTPLEPMSAKGLVLLIRP